MNIKYLPYAYQPEEITEELVSYALDKLVQSVPVGIRESVTLGYETQYDRSIDADGKPGEYVQFYIMWGDEG